MKTQNFPLRVKEVRPVLHTSEGICQFLRFTLEQTSLGDEPNTDIPFPIKKVRHQDIYTLEIDVPEPYVLKWLAEYAKERKL